MALQRKRLLQAGMIVLLLAVNVYVFYVALGTESKMLRVSILDVGQGDAILIQGPGGQTMLIDGGPDRSVVREIPKQLGPLTRDLGLVVETHPDKDHIGGLPDVLNAYRVTSFLSPGLASDTNGYARLIAAIKEEKDMSTYIAKQGQRIHLGDGAYADVLYPNKDVSHLRATNDASIVLRVVYGDTSFLFTGDLPSTIEDELVKTMASSSLQSDVLKAGHHGSKYSTSDAWLRVVDPSTVVISAGKGNTYGHPAPEVLSRVEKSGAQILSTIDLGTITFQSDGKTVRQK